MYAIVDIETTGGYASGCRITEIAIITYDGQREIARFDTLVNPGEPIPPYIQALTGITDRMVAGAPSFSEIALEIRRWLEGHIFVAHNVNFDYSFLKHHLGEAGFNLQEKKLCTVRLARKIFPGLPSYSLGNLCREFSIPLTGRHRAGGDAAATLLLFEYLMANDQEKVISGFLKHHTAEQYLPLHLPKERLENLPWKPGVYYFHDSKEKIIYVGKAVNIRKRVISHFSNNNPGKRKQEFIRNIHGITFQECATELMSLILESIEIHRLWPAYNRSQKKIEQVYGLFSYLDQNGYIRLCIEKRKTYMHPLFTFHRTLDGTTCLKSLVNEFQLCPALCFLQEHRGPCTGRLDGSCYGACEKAESPELYNQRAEAALECLQEDLPSFAFIDRGRHAAEQSCILVEQGKFYGMGYFSGELQVEDLSIVKSLITPFPDNGFIRDVIFRYASLYPDKVRRYSS